MKRKGPSFSFDSRDLMRSKCEHCTRLAVARELPVPSLAELLAQFYEKPENIAIRYGMRFEEKLEQELLQSLGDQVAQPVERTMEATIELMNAGMPVIYQGVLRGGSGALEFSGRPDFLLRSDWRFEFTDRGFTAKQIDGWSGGYTAWDAKLSSTAKPEYQMQVGLYVDVLKQLELAADHNHGLILGSSELATFDADVLIAQMIEVRNPFIKSVLQLADEAPQRIEDIGSLVCDASSYCEICEYPKLCQHMRNETNHLQLVAGITRANIESLSRSGIKTVKQLSEFDSATDKLSKAQVEKLALQARLQQSMYETGKSTFVIVNPEELAKLPPESPGDIFFDLEGFTFYKEPGGLEYLFGFTTIDSAEEFHFSWADNRIEERQSFDKFMHDLLNRVQRFPEMKIYHYAAYEQVALKRLAERYQIYQTAVEELIAGEYFVDLYKVVKNSLMISQESYSIKSLENYYSFKRASDVKEAKGSMDYYDHYLSALAEDPASAEKLKRQVIAYNQDDCASTLALSRWLRSLVDRNV
ncbi:MAG: TM0106 family RecB-like putative nuclease [Actinobacteria bacterium]|uniref:Unannotated protein n=1 Tax=freshwater metagenome TaxID=449393 RepID=A0A6J6C9T3_9ZZZZ|nr:TM0106 family RecB-like putative nuclease [Actinomycetota bacterium]